ncbi:phosphatase PAP2 family protein [Roseovarius nanhaiticus]|uniref:phosphatase PAP2 family protein n=1 Tax=Roseovarius nanhaiticus TaxID=573024 RepID=UPI0024903B43|nr:phosphatase PAP2 family protein [Roseovarius nanhaiticus]
MTIQAKFELDTSAVAGGGLSRLIVQSLRDNGILLVLVLAYYVAALLIGVYTATPVSTVSPTILALMLASLVPIFLATMIIWRFAYMAVAVRPAKPIAWMMQDLKSTFLYDHRRLVSGGIAILAIIFFAAVFAYVKETIPQLNPFSWDGTFARLDRQMHGGHDPYALFSPIFANATALRGLDLAYSAWFLLIYFFSFIACMDRENPMRSNSYLISFTLTWIVGGSVFAVFFSSVGPIYFADFGFGDQFAPLNDMLLGINAQYPLMAVDLQAMLLENAQNNSGVSGISAMPSMHLATSWIMAFHAFRFGKTLGWIMVGFAVVIQLGSVMLGWHYAIDGYAGFLVAAVCWFAGAKLARVQSRIDRSSARA